MKVLPSDNSGSRVGTTHFFVFAGFSRAESPAGGEACPWQPPVEFKCTPAAEWDYRAAFHSALSNQPLKRGETYISVGSVSAEYREKESICDVCGSGLCLVVVSVGLAPYGVGAPRFGYESIGGARGSLHQRRPVSRKNGCQGTACPSRSLPRSHWLVRFCTGTSCPRGPDGSRHLRAASRTPRRSIPARSTRPSQVFPLYVLVCRRR